MMTRAQNAELCALRKLASLVSKHTDKMDREALAARAEEWPGCLPGPENNIWITAAMWRDMIDAIAKARAARPQRASEGGQNDR